MLTRAPRELFAAQEFTGFTEEAPMRQMRVFIQALIGSAVLTSGQASAQQIPPPKIEPQDGDSYTVRYSQCAACFDDGLEELGPGSSSWRYLGSGSRSFSAKAPGTYRYRAVYLFVTWGAAPMPVYGPEASIVVAANGRAAVSNRPSLLEQFQTAYEVRSADSDADGRRDLLIRYAGRGPEPAAGMIRSVLLRRSASGAFEASVPSQSVLAGAEAWRLENVELRPRDVNVDGFADLLLGRVDRLPGFAGAANQILFAPGDTGPSALPELRSVDPDLLRFARDLEPHLIDPEHYPNTAPIDYELLSYYAVTCGWSFAPYGLEYFYAWPCQLEPHYVYAAYRDYSAYHPRAIDIASSEYGMMHGPVSSEQGLTQIEATVEAVLGVALGELDQGEALVQEDDDDTRRGIELFSSLAGIAEALAQERDEAEDPPVIDSVLLKGRRVLGSGPFHTALEYQGETLSAYDSDARVLFDGLLVSEPNWASDHPNRTLRLGVVPGPVEPRAYWGRLKAADSRYGDDLPYDLFPSIGAGGYNSNSYVSGIIGATRGNASIEMSTFVGGEKPVPAGEFN